jgi:hypothetical protein
VNVQRMDEAQHAQRLPAAIDQVAAEPQAVGRGIETDGVEQALQRLQAALDITDCVDGHQCSTRGMLSTNSGIGERKRRSSSVRQP